MTLFGKMLAMPEIAIDEDCNALFDKNQIRLPYRFPIIQAIAMAERIDPLRKHLAKLDLHAACRLDLRHDLAAFFFGKDICHLRAMLIEKTRQRCGVLFLK